MIRIISYAPGMLWNALECCSNMKRIWDRFVFQAFSTQNKRNPSICYIEVFSCIGCMFRWKWLHKNLFCLVDRNMVAMVIACLIFLLVVMMMYGAAMVSIHVNANKNFMVKTRDVCKDLWNINKFTCAWKLWLILCHVPII